MYNPEVTLRIIRWSTRKQPSCWTYGVKAVEKRLVQCCSDHPKCKRVRECCQLYDKFVNATDNPKEPAGDKYDRPRPSVMQTYKFHGLHRIVNPDLVRC